MGSELLQIQALATGLYFQPTSAKASLLATRSFSLALLSRILSPQLTLEAGAAICAGPTYASTSHYMLVTTYQQTSRVLGPQTEMIYCTDVNVLNQATVSTGRTSLCRGNPTKYAEDISQVGVELALARWPTSILT